MSEKLTECGVCQGVGCSYCRDMQKPAKDLISKLQTKVAELEATNEQLEKVCRYQRNTINMIGNYLDVSAVPRQTYHDRILSAAKEARDTIKRVKAAVLEITEKDMDRISNDALDWAADKIKAALFKY